MTTYMTEIIRNRSIVDDPFSVWRPAVDENPAAAKLPETKTIVPFPVFKVHLGQPFQQHGVWLAPDEDPGDLAECVRQIGGWANLALVAVDFPKFTDGRGYSIATLLRTRYGYRGELRAIGDVLQDQLFYMARAGFDSFAVRADKDIHAALAGFDDFSLSYQGAADDPRPLFRRVTRTCS